MQSQTKPRTNSERTMKLDDFLKCKKVRCVSNDYDFNEQGKAYKLHGLRVFITDETGCKAFLPIEDFEPVLDSAENPPQDMKLTPEFEAVEPVLSDNSVNIQDTPKFKVGDKAYFPRLSNKLCVIGKGQEDDYVDEINGSKALAEMHSDLDFVYDKKTNSWLWGGKDCAPQLLHATQESYELLCKLYPHIEFEQPPKELKGSDLCRAMLEKGWKYVLCYVSAESDKQAVETKSEPTPIYGVKHSRFLCGYDSSVSFAVPFDPRTGEPLTEAVLDE